MQKAERIYKCICIYIDSFKNNHLPYFFLLSHCSLRQDMRPFAFYSPFGTDCGQRLN